MDNSDYLFVTLVESQEHTADWISVADFYQPIMSVGKQFARSNRCLDCRHTNPPLLHAFGSVLGN
jgi:hypothetical protein